MNHLQENLEGNIYYHRYYDAEFQIIATQGDQYVCAWLDREEEGFRISKVSARRNHNEPESTWEPRGT